MTVEDIIRNALPAKSDDALETLAKLLCAPVPDAKKAKKVAKKAKKAKKVAKKSQNVQESRQKSQEIQKSRQESQESQEI